MSSQALQHVRVLEVTYGLAAGVAGRLMADLGAKVVRLEVGEGPVPEHLATDLVWQWSRANKSVARNVPNGEVRQTVARLAPGADILLTDLPHQLLDTLGLKPETLSKANKALNVIVVTPFGRSGPYADLPGGDLVVMATSGYLYISGLNDREPLRFGMDMVETAAGVSAAAASLVAVSRTREAGRGQVVDVTHVETVMGMALSYLTYFPLLGTVGRRQASRYTAIGALIPCRNGHVAVVTERVTCELLSALLQDERLLDPRFETPLGRMEHAADFAKALRSAVAKRDKEELFHGAQELRIPFSMAQSPAELLKCAQHAFRGFYQPLSLEDGSEIPAPVVPFKTPGEERPTPRPPEFVSPSAANWPQARPTGIMPRLGTSSSRALEGLKVLEATFAWAGPVAGRTLADYGATAVKVESRRYPDTTRTVPLVGLSFGQRWFDRCPPYLVVNPNKRHLGLELDKPEGREVFLDLVRWADVLIENYTPRVMNQLGLSCDVVSQVNPRLIMLSATGFGQQGPYSRYGAWGWGLEALGGMSYDTGYLNDPDPIWFQVTVPDPVSALAGVVAIMSALEERRHTGKGQWIDLSQYEVCSLVSMPSVLEYARSSKLRGRIGNRHRFFAPQGVYPCAGYDEWVAIGVSTDEQWANLSRVLDRPDLAEDHALKTHRGRQSQHDRLDQMISEWSRGRSKHDAARILQAAGIPAAAVANPRDVHQDPHVKALEFFRAAVATETGLQVYPGPWHHFSDTPGLVLRGAADFGEDNSHVLREILGYSPEQVQHLIAADVLSTAPTQLQRPAAPALPVDVQKAKGLIREWVPTYREVTQAARCDAPRP